MFKLIGVGVVPLFWLKREINLSKIEQLTQEIALPIVEQFGLEYVDCEFTKEGAQQLLIIYVDRPGGVTLEDCEQVSRAVEAVLDERDPIPTSYCLCVSSPGIDRPLKTPRDFERNLGNTVDVKLYRGFNGKKEYTGILHSYDQTHIILKVEQEEIEFARKEIAKIAPHIDF